MTVQLSGAGLMVDSALTMPARNMSRAVGFACRTHHQPRLSVTSARSATHRRGSEEGGRYGWRH
jgi:hypothetical protein